MRGTLEKASCNSTTGGRGRPPALIRLSRWSRSQRATNAPATFSRKKRAREGTNAEVPFPMSPLSLREGGWRSCRSEVWRQLCQPGESRARCARGGGEPLASANAMRGSSEKASCNSTTGGRGHPPALIRLSRWSRSQKATNAPATFFDPLRLHCRSASAASRLANKSKRYDLLRQNDHARGGYAGHSQAAPRTPEESLCSARTIGVSTPSEKT